MIHQPKFQVESLWPWSVCIGTWLFVVVEPRLQFVGKRWDVEYLGAWQNGRKGRARSSNWPGFGVGGQLSGFVGQNLWVKLSKLSKLCWKLFMCVRTCKNHNSEHASMSLLGVSLVLGNIESWHQQKGAIWNLFVSCLPVLPSFPFILHGLSGLSQLSLYFPHFVVFPKCPIVFLYCSLILPLWFPFLLLLFLYGKTESKIFRNQSKKGAVIKHHSTSGQTVATLETSRNNVKQVNIEKDQKGSRPNPEKKQSSAENNATPPWTNMLG